MIISYEDFTKVDIRAGKIIEISDFPEARKPAYKLTIDFGPEVGIKRSSVQAVGAHTKEELLNSLVCCVVNFPIQPGTATRFKAKVVRPICVHNACGESHGTA